MIAALRRLVVLLPLLAASAQAAPLEVALTFDDLPSHGPLPPGVTRVDIAKAVLATLQAHKAPYVYGFINGKKIDDVPADVQVLELWHQAGYPLANHSYSHMDLHKHTAAEFLQDVAANEKALHVFMGGQDWQWFRYPYLREGDTLAKRHEVAQALKQRGYRTAEVTLDFDDYAFNEPYARCVARGDTAAIEGLKQLYMERAESQIEAGEVAARKVFGRDIKHVMLLHIGGFEAVMLPRLLDLLQQRGAHLIRLDEAQSDPVYLLDPDQTPKYGGRFTDLVAASKQIELPRRDNAFFERLEKTCT
ncbi:polysaccharide deacetylase family protein [Roseiterribacter gracilis]|uniref:Chitooligosaccharide deacetylase n=1 Tax=Roseiterribacter gracilis TaxID=2812848 RepID=A0A8S8XIT5_9PROT|nr:polysaccharide deacetylase [Rhodospirillales bacterium TMPK1]